MLIRIVAALLTKSNANTFVRPRAYRIFLTSEVGINLGDTPRGLRHPRGVPSVDPSLLGRKILYAPWLPQVLLHDRGSGVKKSCSWKCKKSEAACVFLANGPSMNVFQGITQTRIWGLRVVVMDALARRSCSYCTLTINKCL